MKAHEHLLAYLDSQRTVDSDALAVWSEGGSLTRGELEGRANQLAHHLCQMGVGPDVMVGIIAERSLEMVVGLLGIVKAGGAYVPIDPEYPDDRIDFMIRDASPPVLLTQSHIVDRLPRTDAAVFSLDADWHEVAALPVTAPKIELGPKNLAYTIYTSGSTGKPKGAMNTHEAIVNRLVWMQEIFRLSDADAVLQKTPFSFDVSVWEFFLPLVTGSRLVMAAPGGHRDPGYLAKIIKEQKITLLHFVPSMLQVFLGGANLRENCRTVRAVVCSGEALSYDLQEQFLQTVDAELHNLYGPTEAAIDVTHWKCKSSGEDRVVPIGYPVLNTDLYVLDKNLEPVAEGEAGELHIGGVQVARGYHNRPELTAERFIDDPFSDQPDARLYKTGDLARWRADGAIEFLGRLDHQIKIRGFRIELGEIEDTLRRHPGIQDAVVTAYTAGSGEQNLAAHVVCDEEHAAPVANTTRYRARAGNTNALFQLPNSLDVCHLNRSETEFMYDEIFGDRCYFQHGIELGPDACVVDVGANIGLFAVQVATEFPSAKVFAFEPIPPLLKILSTNADLYGQAIHVLGYGLGDTNTTVDFTYYEHASILSGANADLGEDRETVARYLASTESAQDERLSQEALEELAETRLTSQSFSCPIRTLSTAISELEIERIDLLKIDVERSELAVLQGIDDDDWIKICQIVAEVHDVDNGLEKFTQLLNQKGFECEVDRADPLAETPLRLVYAKRKSYRPKSETGPEPSPRWFTADALSKSLTAHCHQWLPDYMVPGTIEFLDEYPLTPNGKLDRSALTVTEETTSRAPKHVDSPRDELEAWLHANWEDTLGQGAFGIHDGFFDAGGTSLQAARLVQKLQEKLGEFIYVVTVFEAPTISEYAALLKRQYPERIRDLFGDIAGIDQNAVGVDGDVLSDAEIARFQDLVPNFRAARRDEGTKANKSAAFILAPPRSGTTLLRVMLAGHPGLFAAPELQLLHFDTLADRREAFQGKYEAWLEGTIRVLMELNGMDAVEAKSLMAAYEERNLSTNEFYGLLQDSIGDRLLVDKTPSYALDPGALQHAEKDFKDPIFIHLVRHPIAVIQSFEKMHMDQILLLDEHPYDARQLAELVWLRSHVNILALLRQIPEQRQCRIRFEDLVANPQSVMEKVCDTLSLPYVSELIQPYRQKEKKMTTGLFPESTPMGDVRFLTFSEIRPDVADSWRRVRHNYDLAAATTKLARELGYDLEDDHHVDEKAANRRRKSRDSMRARRNEHRRKKA